MTITAVIAIALAASPLQESTDAAFKDRFEVVSEEPAKVKLGFRRGGRIATTEALEVIRLRLRAKSEGGFMLRWVSKIEGEEIPPPEFDIRNPNTTPSAPFFAVSGRHAKSWEVDVSVLPAEVSIDAPCPDVSTSVAGVGDLIEVVLPRSVELLAVAPRTRGLPAPPDQDLPRCTIKPAPAAPKGLRDVWFDCYSTDTDVRLEDRKLPASEKALGLFVKVDPGAAGHGVFAAPGVALGHKVVAADQPRVVVVPVREGEGSKATSFRVLSPVGLKGSLRVGDRIEWEVPVSMTQAQMQRCSLEKECAATLKSK